MEVKNIDLENGVVKYPITKTKAFEMPLSNFRSSCCAIVSRRTPGNSARTVDGFFRQSRQRAVTSKKRN